MVKKRTSAGRPTRRPRARPGPDSQARGDGGEVLEGPGRRAGPKADQGAAGVSALTAMLKARSWEDRYLAAKKLSSVAAAHRVTALDALRQAIRDEHASVRSQVAVSLGALGLSGALPVLAQMLDDRDPWVRIRTAQSLARVKVAGGAKEILERLPGEADVRVRATYVKAIGAHGLIEHIPVLVSFLSDSDNRVRANTIESLALYDDMRVQEVLRASLKDSSHRVRANAARLLARFDRMLALATFDAMVESEDVYARASAAFALGEIQEPDFARRLVRMMGDQAWVVRRNVIDALVKHGVSLRTTLLERLTSPDPAIRADAVAVLGKTGDKSVYRRLLDLVNDPFGEVRERCEQALSELESRLSLFG